MKKFFRFLLAAAVLSSAAISCSDDPKSEPGPIPGPVNPDKIQTLAKTPEGISLFVTDITSNDFNIRTEMGEDAISYRFNIVSRGRYYNDYMEYLKTNPGKSENDYIINRLVRDDGTGGYGFLIPIDIQWGEAIYKQAAIIPTFDYVIMAVGCLDDKAKVPSEVTSLKFRLKPRDLVGDPRAAIDLASDYRAFRATYTKNADCSAFYQLVPPKEHVDEALAFFAEMQAKDPSLDANLLMRDVICGFEMEPSTENWSVTKDFFFEASPDIVVTAMTVGLDENGTPNTEWESATIGLKEPENKPQAEYEFKIEQISATTAWTNITANWETTSYVCYRFYGESEWAKMDQSEEAKARIAKQLALDGYHQNKDSDALQQEIDLKPNTGYVAVVTAQNKEIGLTPLAVYNFKTLPLVKNKRDESAAQVRVESTAVGKSSISVKYTIPEGTVCWWERILEKGSLDQNGVDLTDPANREVVESFILNTQLGGNLSGANATRAWTWNGFDPNRDYFHYIVGEDTKGYLGNMHVAQYHTTTNNGGDTPKVTITGEVVKRSDDVLLWNVTYTINEDVTSMRYCISGNTFDGEEMDEKAKISAWTDIVLGEVGMKTINTAHLEKIVNKYTQAVALAFPYGKDDCLGELTYLVFDPNTIQSSMLKQVRPFMMAVPPSEDKIQRVPEL